MVARFQNINATKFSLNGIEFHKVFLAFKVNAENLRVVNVYDSKFQLLPATKYSDIEVNGLTYANVTELIAELSDVIYSKSALTQSETEQIEQNRLDIIALQESGVGSDHTHDDRYYTETEIDALELKLKNLDYDSHVLDGNLLKLFDGNTPAYLIDTIDLSFFASQGTNMSQNAAGNIVLSNSYGEILSTLTLKSTKQVIDLGDILTDTIQDAFNDETFDFPIIIRPIGFTEIHAIQNDEAKVWFFVGDSGQYDSVVLAVADDFRETETEIDAKLGNKLDKTASIQTLWTGTQAEYDAIGTKVATTLYFIQ